VLLGGQLSDCEIQEYVEFLIYSLGLESTCDRLVGGLLEGEERCISGGEYKRVSIALALAAAPKALILDEPTSGLDATAAHSLMKLLHSISRQGIMVICVIHQPRIEIFNLLDDVLVLNAGTQAYLGKASNVQSFFEKLGHTFPIASNPADIILDILQTHTPTRGGEEIALQVQIEDSTFSGNQMAEVLALFERVKQRRTSWLRQLWLAFSRSIVQQSQQTTGLALEIGSSAVTGLMIGLAAFESRGHFFQGIYHHPFDLLSSAVDYRLVAEQGLLCCLAIGKASVLLLSTHSL
jgi:ABC-type multidrug transport system ATPase subunit